MRYLLFLSLLFVGCEKNDPVDNNAAMYFPDSIETWKTSSPDEQGWDNSKIIELNELLEENGTRAFIVLKDGKIVLEHYFGKNLLGTGDFGVNSNWYWASAAKTITSFLIGQAEEDGFLTLNESSSKYLGKHWTSMSLEKEEKIHIKHQLSMSTGLDDTDFNLDNTSPNFLSYKSDPEQRWAYHNAPYTLLSSVLEEAVGEEFDDYFERRLKQRIGMDGFWTWVDYNHLYFSTARSMALYGLLIQNEGNWKNEEALISPTYFQNMTTPSQQFNQSYGYLWWLNGQTSYMLPGSQIMFPGSLTPNAPNDMISAIGKFGQYLNIVPSKGLVMVRMGENPNDNLVPTNFQNQMWDLLSEVID